ncbi:hypothetical protein AKJ09_10428 [Labilithrix luteola]|uniref:Uncharacterized protein n=1 Tax=Labilithrix luteola TaxID=1391654 RepID=A0A0K1QEC4_9BACT|nr:hypothetical protein AKJ09_10428 [Labilithrix luteola]
MSTPSSARSKREPDRERRAYSAFEPDDTVPGDALDAGRSRIRAPIEERGRKVAPPASGVTPELALRHSGDVAEVNSRP